MKYMRTFFYLDKFIKEFAKHDGIVTEISTYKTNIQMKFLDKIIVQIIFDYAYVQINFSITSEELTKCFYERCIGFKPGCGSYGSWKIFEAKLSYDNVCIGDVLDQRFAANRYLAINGIGRLLKKRDIVLSKFSFYIGSLDNYTKKVYNFSWKAIGEEKTGYLKPEDFFIDNYLMKMINPMWLNYAKALR